MTEVHYVLLTADEFHRIMRGEAVVPESLKEKGVDNQGIPKSPWIYCGNHIDDADGLTILRAVTHRATGLAVKIASLAPEMLDLLIEIKNDIECAEDTDVILSIHEKCEEMLGRCWGQS